MEPNEFDELASALGDRIDSAQANVMLGLAAAFGTVVEIDDYAQRHEAVEDLYDMAENEYHLPIAIVIAVHRQAQRYFEHLKPSDFAADIEKAREIGKKGHFPPRIP